MALPWLPLLVMAQAGDLRRLTPEIMGALAIVLAARVLGEGALTGTLQFLFGFVPLIGATVVCAGATPTPGGEAWHSAIAYYVGAGLGTTLAAISELRGRR